jgi:hypothetical protein
LIPIGEGRLNPVGPCVKFRYQTVPRGSPDSTNPTPVKFDEKETFSWTSAPRTFTEPELGAIWYPEIGATR